jgi:hypothetical protein
MTTATINTSRVIDETTHIIRSTGEQIRFKAVQKWCGIFWTCDRDQEFFAKTKGGAYRMTPEERRDTVSYVD